VSRTRFATLYMICMASAWTVALLVIGAKTGHLLACALTALASLAAGGVTFWAMVRAFGMPGKRRRWDRDPSPRSD
jgi:hypothetical protein